MASSSAIYTCTLDCKLAVNCCFEQLKVEPLSAATTFPEQNCKDQATEATEATEAKVESLSCKISVPKVCGSVEVELKQKR